MSHTLIDLGDEDPYFTVKKDVEVALNKAGEFFASFNSMLADPAAADASEFDWTVKELRKLVSSVTEDLDELADTVDAIKADPKRFKVTLQEIGSREQFVKGARSKVQNMTVRLNDPKAKLQNYTNARESLLTSKAKQSRYTRMETEIANQNQQFIESHVDQQQAIIKEQDRELEGIHEDVVLLGQMGRQIGDELDEQDGLLTNLGTEMDTVQARLTATLTRLDKAMGLSKDRKQTCCICLLIVIVIVLIILYVAA